MYVYSLEGTEEGDIFSFEPGSDWSKSGPDNNHALSNINSIKEY